MSIRAFSSRTILPRARFETNHLLFSRWTTNALIATAVASPIHRSDVAAAIQCSTVAKSVSGNIGKTTSGIAEISTSFANKSSRSKALRRWILLNQRSARSVCLKQSDLLFLVRASTRSATPACASGNNMSPSRASPRNWPNVRCAAESCQTMSKTRFFGRRCCTHNGPGT